MKSVLAEGNRYQSLRVQSLVPLFPRKWKLPRGSVAPRGRRLLGSARRISAAGIPPVRACKIILREQWAARKEAPSLVCCCGRPGAGRPFISSPARPRPGRFGPRRDRFGSKRCRGPRHRERRRDPPCREDRPTSRLATSPASFLLPSPASPVFPQDAPPPSPPPGPVRTAAALRVQATGPTRRLTNNLVPA
jgi:hypothetical protein